MNHIFKDHLVLCDAHAHIGSESELKSRRETQLRSLICASTPIEASKLKKLSEEPGYSQILVPTYGLHPWHASEYQTSDMESYLSSCSVIGEIGMDSVWCSVPLDVQERIFREQLIFAAIHKKPVILHTKGQEKEIAAIIRDYPNTYLVHWYSCPDHLEAYLEQNCYYSIGPDVVWNPAVQKTAASVPADRILIETDGMNAVRWAFEEGSEQDRKAPATPYESLKNTLMTTACIRKTDAKNMAEQVHDNLSAFLGFL